LSLPVHVIVLCERIPPISDTAAVWCRPDCAEPAVVFPRHVDATPCLLSAHFCPQRGHAAFKPANALSGTGHLIACLDVPCGQAGHPSLHGLDADLSQPRNAPRVPFFAINFCYGDGRIHTSKDSIESTRPNTALPAAKKLTIASKMELVGAVLSPMTSRNETTRPEVFVPTAGRLLARVFVS